MVGIGGRSVTGEVVSWLLAAAIALLAAAGPRSAEAGVRPDPAVRTAFAAP